MLGQLYDSLGAVENTDFLCVCGGFSEGVAACRKGGAGDGKLAAGGPTFLSFCIKAVTLSALMYC